MKYLLITIDWLYYLSLELFISAHIDKGRGVDHFYDDKRAHILTCSIITPWLILCVCVVSYVICPDFKIGENDRLQIITILLTLFLGFFLIKRYNYPMQLFEHHKNIFNQWELPKQIFMMLLPIFLCIASWAVLFYIYNLLYKT